MNDACETPMSDHVARFWRLLEDEHVRILLDLKRTVGADAPDGPVVYWDGATFSDDVAKALVADRAAIERLQAALEEVVYMAGMPIDLPAEDILANLGATAKLALDGHGRGNPGHKAGGPAAREWLPIETAPKDGTVIELTWMEGGKAQEIWPLQWGHIQKNGLFPGTVGMWVTPDGSITWNADDPDGAPTHWRPLTSPDGTAAASTREGPP